MTDDEREKIYLEHKLEWHRIWRGKILTLLILAIGWVVAAKFGQEIASGFRKAELEHQSKLDVARDNCKVYYEKSFAVQMAAESLYVDLYESYRSTLYSISKNPSPAELAETRLAILQKSRAFKDMIRRHYIYLDVMYADQAQRHGFLYNAILELPPNEWGSYQSFLLNMKNTLSAIGRTQLRVQMGLQSIPDYSNQFLLEKFEPVGSNGKIDYSVLYGYLQAEHARWESAGGVEVQQYDTL